MSRSSSNHTRTLRHRGRRPPSGGVSALPAGLLREDGITLVELMAALVISLLVMAAGFTALIASNKAARVNSVVADTQQNVRIAMELIARDIKLAGFGMTGAVGACGTGIVPGDNNPVGVDTGPDTISLVVPTTNTTITPAWTVAAPGAVGPFTQITMNGGAASSMDAAAGGGGALVGRTISIGGAVSSIVTAVNVGSDQITLQDQVGAPKTFPAGTQVFLLECVSYFIGTTTAACAGPAPCLMRNVNGGAGVPMVEGIEDIQFAYACDGCVLAINGGVPDGIPDDFDAVAGFTPGDFVTDSPWNVNPMTPDKIELVQINVVARQTDEDTARDRGVSEGRARQIALDQALQVSDHNHSDDAGFTLATYQLDRRRVLTRTVQTRNLGP